MPGRDSYGPAGRWVHDRAHHIMSKNPSMSKSIAYAVATQQAHKTGKSPKGFRTAQGVRDALAKHRAPKKLYKKTAGEKMKKIALARLHQMVKEAKLRRLVKFRSGGNVVRGDVVRGAAKLPQKAQKKQLYVPHGMKAKKRGRIGRYFGGSSMKTVPTVRSRVGGIAGAAFDRFGGSLAARMRAASRTKRPAGRNVLMDVPMEAIQRHLAPTKSKALSPTARKALKGAGLAGVGAGAGAAGHQIAYSTGLSQTGPADTIANLVVPTEG